MMLISDCKTRLSKLHVSTIATAAWIILHVATTKGKATIEATDAIASEKVSALA